MPTALKLFFSYSHNDEALRKELHTHLALLKRQGLIEGWHDRMIPAGTDWAAAIDDNLEKADVIVLLVSADFLASNYCYEKEMTRAMERNDAGEALVIPVILRPCDWAAAPFAKLQGLPRNATPVTKWGDRDDAWVDVAAGIRRTVETLQQRRAGATGPSARPR
jgi:hypothetical protein